MKNCTVEFYRFCIAMVIAIFHFNIQFTGKFLTPKGGYLGVVFFFILSGFFVMKTFKSEEHPRTAWNFWMRRIRHLYPVYILMMVFFLLFDIFIRHYVASPLDFVLRLGNEIWDLLLLQHVGLDVFAYEGGLWFLVALSINLYVIYYLLLNYEKFYIDFLIPVLSILLYGYIGKTFGSLSMQNEWLGGVFYGGLVRGFLDMGLGVATYQLTEVFDKCSSHFLNIIEILVIIYITIILNIGFCIEDFKILILFPILIACTMTKKSNLSRLLDCRMSEFLGSISYEIYLCHLMISTTLTMYWHDLNYWRALLIFIAGSLILAIVVHFLLSMMENIIGMLKIYKYSL